LYFISPYAFQPWVYQSLPAQLGQAANVKKILNLIPQNASFSTSGYIVSHLWDRRNIIGLQVERRREKSSRCRLCAVRFVAVAAKQFKSSS